jgi:pimeloyl-ACP methyl ester carboxylesterase
VKRLALLLLSAGVVACSANGATDAWRDRYPGFRECQTEEGHALCGSISVPENRDAPARKIQLRIRTLMATGSSPKADPIVPVQGGPGQGAVQLGGLFSRLLADLRRDRDIILIDMRGTGESHRLSCDALSPEWLRSGDLMPVPLVRACRAELEAKADLTQYTTAILARDLDDVRKALGIERWNLYGTSYGTRLALEYARSYGARVRTMTLHGVAAPSLAMPLPYAKDSQAALDRLLDDETRRLLPGVLARLQQEPAVVATAAGEVNITPGVFSEALRNLIYDAGAAPRAAAMIRNGSEGDFSAAAEAVLRQRRGFGREIAMGMFLSVTCTEDIPRIDEAKIDEASRGTFLGDYRVRQQMAACGAWPRGGPSVVGTPIVSDVPTLLVSGELDPVTPPRFGDEVLAGLKNGVHLTLPGEAHGFGPATGCVMAAMKDLVDTADASRVAPRCEGRVSRK